MPVEKSSLANIDNIAQSNQKMKLAAWASLATLSFLSIYFTVFMEWLFYITKPSFMDFIPFATKLGILLISGLFLAGLCLPLFLLLFFAGLIPGLSRYWKVFLWVGGIIPAVFLASTTLLMLDNFTYTVFHFGIINAKGNTRGVYALVYILVLLVCYRWVFRALARQAGEEQQNAALKAQLASSAAILVLTIPLGLYAYSAAHAKTTGILPETGSAVQRPNILLIGSDALNADHLSVYGYARDTTPFLREFAKDALVSTNNFPNSSISSGSFASIYSGKLPTKTRVLFPPDILRGADAVQHFPGILEQEGYFTAQISVDYYADSTQMNLQDGFFLVNNRSATSPELYRVIRRYVPQDVAYFLSTLAKRLDDRLAHIFFIRTMPNLNAEVFQGLLTTTDQQRIDQTLSLFENTSQPLFVSVYMLGTHMYILTPREHVFSKEGEPLTTDNEIDVYDDAVLSFDAYLRQVMEALEQMGKLDQTLIIVYSDHGRGDASNVRLPLIMRFPNGEYAGQLVNNTQNLDIAPTILDYLGIQPPSWMAGQSLLRGEPPANRPVFSAVPNFTYSNDLSELQLDLSKIKPPFYQFGTIGMVVCQKKYTVETSTLTWQEDEIPGYPTPCDPATLPDEGQSKQMMLDQLQADGFDISTLRAALGIAQR